MPYFNLLDHPRTPYLKLILIYIFMARDETFSLPQLAVHLVNTRQFFSDAKTEIDKAKALIKKITIHKLQNIAEIIVQENLAPSYQLKNYTSLTQLIIEKFVDKIKNSPDHNGVAADEIKLYEDRTNKPIINTALTDGLISLLNIPDPNNPPAEIFTTLLQLTRRQYPLLKDVIVETLKPFAQTNADIATLLNKETALTSASTNIQPSLTSFFNTPPETTATQPLVATQSLPEPATPPSRLVLRYSSDGS